jgi:hypothetical protein
VVRQAHRSTQIPSALVNPVGGPLWRADRLVKYGDPVLRNAEFLGESAAHRRGGGNETADRRSEAFEAFGSDGVADDERQFMDVPQHREPEGRQPLQFVPG